MSQRIFLTVVVCVFLCKGEIFAQQKNVEKIPAITGIFTGLTKIRGAENSLFHSKKIPGNTPEKWNNSQFILFSKPIFFQNMLNPVSKDHYAKSVGFFCQKELQVEKITSIPLRLRLGSLEYTDYLEKKPNSFLNR